MNGTILNPAKSSRFTEAVVLHRQPRQSGLRDF